jgi:hypothetical protein
MTKREPKRDRKQERLLAAMRVVMQEKSMPSELRLFCCDYIARLKSFHSLK